MLLKISIINTWRGNRQAQNTGMCYLWGRNSKIELHAKLTTFHRIMFGTMTDRKKILILHVAKLVLNSEASLFSTS